MKPVPDWPRISSSVHYQDAQKAIDWLCAAFGFQVRIQVPGENGKIMHAELTYGDGVIMVADPNDHHAGAEIRKPPSAVGGANTQCLFAYVDDVQAHHDRAKAAGARVVEELRENDYGPDYWTDRSYQCVDLGGHHWWFAQRIRTGGT